MALPPIITQTGDVNLPDIGTLSYNNIEFSYMFHTRINGKVVSDDAKRITKLIDYTLYVEGVVTSDDTDSTDDGLDILRDNLTIQGGTLIYSLRGFGTYVVSPVVIPGNRQDVAWGPMPRLLEFTPLGGARSAFVRWEIDVAYTQVEPETGSTLGTSGGNLDPVLQFNWDYSLRYDEDHYLSYKVAGVLEIPLTYTASGSRIVSATVDDFRQRWLDMTVDLTKFRVTERSFEYSRDKRTANWVFSVEQLKPMGIPPGCSTARGTFSCRNSNAVVGKQGNLKLTFQLWQCSLRVTYTVRNDQDQRVAFLAFYSLLWWRMQQSRFGDRPGLAKTDPKADMTDAGAKAAAEALKTLRPPPAPAAAGDNAAAIWQSLYKAATVVGRSRAPAGVILTDFGFDEGLFLDSDKHTFHASWIISTNWKNLLAATGFTQYQPGTAGRTGNLWRQSIRNVVGWRGPLAGRLDSTTDVLVDIGGGTPWGS